MAYRNYLAVLILLVGLSGCSVLKQSTKKKDVNVERQVRNDIIRQTLENIQLEIPQQVFENIVRSRQYRQVSDSVANATSDCSVSTQTPENNEPVRITINRTTTEQDQSVTTVDSTSQTETEETIEKESKGILDMIGGWGAIATLAVIMLIYLFIRIKF